MLANCLKLLLLAASLFLFAACAKPTAPTLKPQKAVVKAVTLSGVNLELTIEAHNPNSIALEVQKVKARTKLGDTLDLGEVTVSSPMKLPAKKSTSFTAPISLPWKNVAEVAMMAMTKDTIPFTIEGTAEIGGEDINFDVPFKTEGTLTKAELIALVGGALPPGLSIPSALPF